MEVEARAPGKVILCGEHAVVHGSAAVAASLNRYTRAHIRLSPPSESSDVVSLNLVNTNVHLQWPLQVIKSAVDLVRMDGSSAVLSSSSSTDLLARLENMVDDQELPEAVVGTLLGVKAFLFLYTSILGSQPSAVTVTSELPLGAGLGSSASFCVALSAALLTLAKKVDWNSFGDIQSYEDKANPSLQTWLDTDDNGSELINKWAFEGEKIIHGRPSGIDNTVSSYGHLVKLKRGQLKRMQKAVSLRMLITDTKVGRNTKALVAGVGERALQHPKVMAAVFQAIDVIVEDVAGILESASEDGTLKTEQETRLEELVEMNQGLLLCMGVGHPSIEAVCRTSFRYQLRSKLTGAGGGGCVLTLLPEQISAKTLEKVQADMNAQGFFCFEAAIGGKGVQVAFGHSLQ